VKNGFQLVLAFVVFLTVALSAAVSIGSGDYVWPAVLGLGAFGVILLVTVGRHLPIDMAILCVSVGAFYVLGKGYAYINAAGFLFTGEATLLICLLGYLYRLGNRVYPLIPKTPMAPALLLLGCYALIRLPIDYGVHGLMAMRDACVIYYTLFFFVAYQLGLTGEVQKWAPAFLIVAALPGLVLDILNQFVPSAFLALTSVTLRGNPIMLNHPDAIHPAIFGLIMCAAVQTVSGKRFRLLSFVALLVLVAYMMGTGRGANYVTFVALCTFLLLARQIQLLAILGIGVLFLVCTLFIVAEINPKLGAERIRKLTDQLAVIFMPGVGMKSKTTDANTAEWRLYWWKHITNDVNQKNPLFGLGFGTDIATEFHKRFFRTPFASPEIARTRGAHNAFFTVLARMGWLGALFFCGVVGVQLWYFILAIRALRYGLLPSTQAFLWGSNICGFVITFFQYAWEASYSAIPFWTCLGLSYAFIDQLRRQPAEVPAPRTLSTPGPERRPQLVLAGSSS
jgi:hypothetical protein